MKLKDTRTGRLCWNEKTSQCVDKFRFDISGVEHEKAKNNVDWSQVFDEYPRYNSL